VVVGIGGVVTRQMLHKRNMMRFYTALLRTDAAREVAPFGAKVAPFDAANSKGATTRQSRKVLPVKHLQLTCLLLLLLLTFI